MSLSVSLWTSNLFPLPLTPFLQLWLHVSALFFLFPSSQWRCLTNSFLAALPFPNQIHPSLPHPSLTEMDGGLHPFIAFTYFSAHPLNDTHSYTQTLHPSFHLPQNSCSFHTSSACHSTGFHFPPIYVTPFPPPSCAPFCHLLSLSLTPHFMQLASPCTTHLLFLFPYPILLWFSLCFLYILND